MGRAHRFVGSTFRKTAALQRDGISPEGFSGASALIQAPTSGWPLGIRSQLGSAFGDSETMHDLG